MNRRHTIVGGPDVPHRGLARAFSMIELVIVVSIIAVVAAIAIPRFGTFVETAQDNGDAGELAKLRRAIEHYREEHGAYPGGLTLERQLTQFTDENGSVSATRTHRYRFGPYLRSAPSTYSSGVSGAVLLNKKTLSAARWLYFEKDGAIVSKADAIARVELEQELD